MSNPSETGSDVACFYLAVVQDDGADEPPSAAGQFASVHQVLQLRNLNWALKPVHIQPNYHLKHDKDQLMDTNNRDGDGDQPANVDIPSKQLSTSYLV